MVVVGYLSRNAFTNDSGSCSESKASSSVAIGLRKSTLLLPLAQTVQRDSFVLRRSWLNKNDSKLSKSLTESAKFSDMERVPRDSTWKVSQKIGERMKSTPHFVLFSRTGEQPERGIHGSSWYFRLQSSNGENELEASDEELGVSPERLELLAVVRGLEALEQPSSVTLVTSSKQVSRAVRQGLEYWRARGWKWERFGQKVPMKNGDLWQRIDRAMQIHDIRCRTYRVDKAHACHTPHSSARYRSDVKQRKRRSQTAFRPIVAAARVTASGMHRIADALQRLLPDTPPNPHPSL